MPNESKQGTYPLRISEEFSQGLAAIWSKRLLDHIQRVLVAIAAQPEIGSADVRESLTRLYGNNIRKFAVSTFVIVYRFDGESVDVLALVYGPGVK